MSDPVPPPAPVEGYSRLFVRVACGVAFLGGGAVGFYATVLVALVTANGGEGQLHTRPFDAMAWRAPDWQTSYNERTGFHSIRQEMVDELLQEHLLVGLDREGVRELIGPPDPDPYFHSTDPAAWVYWLGSERGIGVDFEWLFVSFDPDGRVQSAWLATD